LFVLPSLSDLLAFLLKSVSIAFLFSFFLFFPAFSVLFLQMFTVGGRGTYALETEVSFLSSLVSSPSAAQTTAKDLWPGRLSPKTEAEIQSAMAD
jgi:hypothetical protein